MLTTRVKSSLMNTNVRPPNKSNRKEREYLWYTSLSLSSIISPSRTKGNHDRNDRLVSDFLSKQRSHATRGGFSLLGGSTWHIVSFYLRRTRCNVPPLSASVPSVLIDENLVAWCSMSLQSTYLINEGTWASSSHGHAVLAFIFSQRWSLVTWNRSARSACSSARQLLWSFH